MPYVRATVAGERGKRKVKALVDSGASLCVADIDIAASIGATLDKTKPYYISGVGAEYSVPTYPANVKLRVEGLKELDVAVYFGELGKGFTLILGQSGFFDRFRITFKRYGFTFNIDPPRRI